MLRFEAFLDLQSERRPEKIAIALGDSTLTYKAWREGADRFAAELIENGVVRGDRVIIYMETAIEVAIAIFGVLKAGAVFSVVNASTKQEKLAFILNNCQATALVIHHRLLPQVKPALERTASIKACWIVGDGDRSSTWKSWETALQRGDVLPLPPVGISLDLAMIIYTSGSTGEPKGVMMTHENIDAASWSITTYLENTENDVIL